MLVLAFLITNERKCVLIKAILMVKVSVVPFDAVGVVDIFFNTHQQKNIFRLARRLFILAYHNFLSNRFELTRI